MITHLTLKNFKSVKEQTYDFTQFDLLVGRNNSGKSTALQALAIWQFCIDEFHRSKREAKGIQVVLPNFSALPLPEFNLLWKDRTIRRNPLENGKKTQEYILIEIILKWNSATGESCEFGVALRYHSPQSIYAMPIKDWKEFRRLETENLLPSIAYVPPFSGLEPAEEWRDDGPLRKQVGKGQPGSVLRNLLYRVVSPESVKVNPHKNNKVQQSEAWDEINKVVQRWFGVKLNRPEYLIGIDTQIKVEYKQVDKNFDIIAAGSGFHQALTLLGFLYGYKPTTILLDEPDAHLHVKLQRELLDYFKIKSNELNIQFLIATHAEEFVKGVDSGQIISMLANSPKRQISTPSVLKAMSEISNEDVIKVFNSPFVLYVEGEDDERILRAWADKTGTLETLNKYVFMLMNGGSKQYMRDNANKHFKALQQIVPSIKRTILFDFDDASAWHPDSSDTSIHEWKRKNIDNYLLVNSAWKRAAAKKLSVSENDLLFQPISQLIDNFFASENLTKPINQSWKTISANIFSVVNGKHLLFENDNALFHELKNSDSTVIISKSDLALNMLPEEIHSDVDQLFVKLNSISTTIDN